MPLSPECLEQLHLRQEPFDASATGGFLYTDALLDSINEIALKALVDMDSILILTGMGGSGRSTQLMRLLGALPSEFEYIAFRGRTNTSFAAVEITIRNHLRATGDDDPERTLAEVLAAPSLLGIDQVIAIDDAHLLGVGIIGQIMQLREEVIGRAGRGPRLVLVGDAVLARRRLQMLEPEAAARVRRVTLPAFNIEQTRAYLCHRLANAGSDNPCALLKPMDLVFLHQRSGGAPASLNEVATDWLIRVCRALGKTAANETDENSSSDDTEDIEDVVTTNTEIETSEERNRTVAIAQDEPAPASDTQTVAVNELAGRPDFSFDDGDQRDRADSQGRWLAPTIASGAIAVLLLAIYGNLPEIVPLLSDDPTGKPARAMPMQSAPSAGESSAQPPAADGGPGTAGAIGQSSAPADQRSVASLLPAAEFNSRSVWLRQQNDDWYSIQLIALRDFAAVEDYVIDSRLHGVRIIPTRSLVIALFGNFRDAASAAAAAEQLPAAVRAHGYRIRSFRDIKADAGID